MEICTCTCKHCTGGVHCGQGEIEDGNDGRDAVYCRVEVERGLTVTERDDSGLDYWQRTGFVRPTEYDNDHPNAVLSDVEPPLVFQPILRKATVCRVFGGEFEVDLVSRYHRAWSHREFVHPGILVTLQSRIKDAVGIRIDEIKKDLVAIRGGRRAARFRHALAACDEPRQYTRK